MSFQWTVSEGMNTLLPSLVVWWDKKVVKQKNALFQFSSEEHSCIYLKSRPDYGPVMLPLEGPLPTFLSFYDKKKKIVAGVGAK